MIPPMVGPTWSRVAYSLGSDYVLAVVSGDLPRGLGRRMCYLVRSRCVVSCVGPTVPPAVACVPSYPIAPCSWGCNSTSHCLVIMRVCVRLHGTLYPMTDCVLYLGRLL